MLLSFFYKSLSFRHVQNKVFRKKNEDWRKKLKAQIWPFQILFVFVTLPFAKISTKMTELGALPPGWDTKFDPRTGR